MVQAKRTRSCLVRVVGAVVAGAFFLTNVTGLSASEKNFWGERNAASRRRVGAPLLARIPAGRPIGTIPQEFIPSFNSAGSKNQISAFHRSFPPDAVNKLSWLPNVVAPYGDISEIHLASTPNAPLLIHLQDAHEIEEAQGNIAGLVGALQSQQGISLVGVEGAVGGFSLAPYRSSPNPDITRGLANAFLKMGYLTGPEVAGIVAVEPPTLWGVEDLTLYRDHVEAFKTSERMRPHVQSLVATLASAATALREKIYPARLRSMDDHRLAYLAKRESLGDYAQTLAKSFKGTLETYPHTRRLLDTAKWERSLDFQEVEQERLKLVGVLVQRLTPRALNTLVQESVAYRSGRRTYGDYHRFLLSLCHDNGIRLDTYGPLNAYLSYVLLAEQIDPNTLLQEISDLERAVLLSLAETEEQRQLVRVRRDLSLLEKLTAHGLTPAEWKTYETERNSILEIPKTLVRLGCPVGIGETLTAETVAPFEMFCARALDRNNAMVKNLLEKMRIDKSTSAIFVAGGFHTDGVTQILRRENVSYVVVTPKITKAPESTRPLDVFSRAPLPLEKLLSGDVIHLAYAQLLQTDEGTVPFAPAGPQRQGTLRLSWVALQNALESELSQHPHSPMASAFHGLTAVSKKPLELKGGLSGFLFQAMVDGHKKQFKVVLAKKNAEPNTLLDRDELSADPLSKMDIVVGKQTYDVRVYASSPGTEVAWGTAGFNRVGRYLARSFHLLSNPRSRDVPLDFLSSGKDIFDLYRKQMDYLAKEAGLLPHRTRIHLAHAERTTVLAKIIAGRWNDQFPAVPIDSNDPRLVLSAAAHDLGKLSPHLAPLFLEGKTFARHSPEYKALHEHEEAAFDVAQGWGYQIPEGPSDVLRYASALHPYSPAPPPATSELTLKIIAGIELLADVLDAQLDLHRPYKTEQWRQGTLPTAQHIVDEFNRYLQVWEQSSDPSENQLANDFRALAASLLKDDTVLRAIETTFFERAAESYLERFSTPPETRLDYQERFLGILSSIWDFQLYARHTPLDQWWPRLLDRTILKGAEGNDRTERHVKLGEALSLSLQQNHSLLHPSGQGRSDFGLRDALNNLTRGQSIPPLSPRGAWLLFGSLEKTLYRGGVLQDVLERIEPIFVRLFGSRFGSDAARYGARVIGVPLWEDSFGGFKFNHVLRSTFVPLLVGHFLVTLAGGNVGLGLFSAVVIFLASRLLYFVAHPSYARKDAGLITLTSTVVALGIAVGGGFSPPAILAAYTATLANHILVNAWLNRWFFRREHAPGVPAEPVISRDPNVPVPWGRGSDHPGSAVVIGDADASLPPIKKILRAEGLVDEGDHWVGGRRVVAQVGDVVGRGDQAKELYQYLFRLQAEARRAGGEVILLLGNHEMALLINEPIGGDFKENESAQRDELRTLLATAVLAGQLQGAAVIRNAKEEPFLLLHAGYSKNLSAELNNFPVWIEWIDSHDYPKEKDPLLDEAFLLQFFNQAVVRIAEHVQTRPTVRARTSGDLGQYLNRINGILMGPHGVMNRVATFQDNGFEKMKQIIGHSVASTVRYQDDNEQVVNTDSGLFRPKDERPRPPIYLRLTKDGIQRAVEIGRFGERRVYRLGKGFDRPQPVNFWAWAVEIKDRVTLKLWPLYWLRLHIDHANTLEELVATYARFYDVLGRGRLPWHRRGRPALWEESRRLLENALWSQRAPWSYLRTDGSEEETLEEADQYSGRFSDLMEVARAIWKKIPEVHQGEVLPIFFATRNARAPEVSPDQMAVLDGMLEQSPAAVLVQTNGVVGVYEILVKTSLDRVGLLADMTGVIAAHGYQILVGDVRATEGKVMAQFIVSGASEDSLEERTERASLKTDMRDLLLGVTTVDALFQKHNRPYQLTLTKGPGAPPSVVGFRNGNLTVLTPDRNEPGLLHAIARKLADLDCNISLAPDSIRTQGDTVYDFFKVMEADGTALSPQRKIQVTKELELLLKKPVITADDFKSEADLFEERVGAEAQRAVTFHDLGLVEGVLLGGPANPIQVGRHDVNIEKVHAAVHQERLRAQAARDSLEKALGAWDLRDAEGHFSEHAVVEAGQRLGQDVRRRSETTADSAKGSRLVMTALVSFGEELAGEPSAEWARWAALLARGFNENLFEIQERIMSSINNGRRMEIEVSETMLKGTPTEEDNTRLEELAVLAAHADQLTPGQVTWVLPNRTSSIDTLWSLSPALAGLKPFSLTILTKADFLGEHGKYSVKRLLLESQGTTEVQNLDPADLFLVNRDEWVLENDLPRDVARLLIALPGGMLYDATEKVTGELKNLFYLKINA